ncbi:mesoderm induction early response protein 1 isoform X2 [Rhagoletis pomonella]|uniref:mesoderm induction early response protein 1 isoform X2 n=1 Tax=Rhagoletis pomonella TaxID=28610 RepID=UPI001785A6D3|nr:mesoderm induction early response protein 1 isoform X2 [Rhagoletis pomonella]
MSSEPDAKQINCSKFESAEEGIVTTVVENANNTMSRTEQEESCHQIDCSVPRKQRERRNKSPIAISTLLETFAAPLSPASSCTSQGNSSADATFEPSIDMMVNDFDDEQTLNEEEALAAMEQQDPHDEIATLKEEGEMPLEELLAKYQGAPPIPVHIATQRKKNKRSAGSGKHSKHRKTESDLPVEINISEDYMNGAIEPVEENQSKTKQTTANELILIEESNDEDHNASKLMTKSSLGEEVALAQQGEDCMPARNAENNDSSIEHVNEKTKHRRSHLMDLYPEESFTEVLNSGDGTDKDLPLKPLFNEYDEIEDINEVEEEEEEGEFDSDYVKKTIMVGPSYQATIPDGLSQYGDVLPYENEDKLIWEPSQVSERQVEEYLLKARDIKPCMLDSVDEETEECNETNSAANKATEAIGLRNGSDTDNKEFSKNHNTDDVLNLPSSLANNECGDATAVIKDNEQALHLLVQCGYDFKEALRRKRLNALPLTGSMSLWSEEECHKFEEGIQKFGKDFLKIRQNQVRTRTMRELVQFYYLWKKSDRRDHNFANSDTVDHMDIYLNEGGDYSPTSAINGTAGTGHSTNNNGAPTLGVRKNNACAQKNPISIMMTGSTNINNCATTTTAAATQLNVSNSKVANNRKRNAVGHPNNNYENPITPNIPLSPAQTK